MTGKEIIKRLEEQWPPEYAYDWDNVGLLVGREEKEVSGIFVCLDVTEETIQQALECDADMIVSHHPLLFSAVKRINSRDFMGRRLIRLIQEDLICYAMHTNFDVLGMAELNREYLGLSDCTVLEVTGERNGSEEGIGRVGYLKEEKSLEEWSRQVKESLNLPQVLVYGDGKKVIRRVAVSGGSGKSMIGAALDKKADVLVTGDIDYHSGIDAVAQGMAIIDAGHYGTEYMFIPHVAEKLKTIFPELKIKEAMIQQPFTAI